MKNIQIITLIALALLYSCSFLKSQNNAIDDILEHIFKKELDSKKPLDNKRIHTFFNELEKYADITSNILLADAVEKIQSKIDEFAENVLNETLIKKEGEDLDHMYHDFLKSLYDNLMANYEPFLVVVDNINQKLDQIKEKLEKLAITDSDLKEELESINQKYFDRVMVLNYLYTMLIEDSSYYRRRKILQQKLNEVMNQAISEYSNLLKSYTKTF